MLMFVIRSIRFWMFAGILACALPVQGAQPDAIRGSKGNLLFVADSWCPYNCTTSDSRPGYLVELAIQIFGNKGYQVEYQVMPWKRAIEMTKAGQVDAVLAVCDIEAEGLVKTRKPVGIMQNTVATTFGKPFKWTGVEAIGNRRAAMINGYGYGKDLLDWAVAHPDQVDYSVGAGALESMIKKLASGHVDFLQDDIHVLEYRLGRMGLRQKVVLQAEGDSYPLRIGFAPTRPDSASLAKMFDDGVAEMRRSGALAKLLKSYGMKDWEVVSKKKH